jgi:hypothetical protein
LTHGTRRIRNVVLLSIACAAPSARAAQSGGGVVGWVEDPARRAGAGRGRLLLRPRNRRSRHASDSTGRFFLPALTPGSYTVRALTRNKLVAPPRQITVLPNRDFTFTMSLQETLPRRGGGAREADSESKKSTTTREINWLLRHKRRSVLEARGQDGGFDPVWSRCRPLRPAACWPSWIPSWTARSR